MDAKEKLDALARGLDLFNRGEFFICHEVLERIWLEESEEEKPFYQGLIQVAAGFHHWQNGNRRGALSLLEAGGEKLRRYPPACNCVDLAALLADLASWLAYLGETAPPAEPPLPVITLTR